MATAPKPPSANTVAGKPSKRTRQKGSSNRKATAGAGYFSGVRAKINGLIGSGPMAHVLATTVPVAEVVGTGFVASALSGYREAQGKDLKIGPVDARVLAGLGFMGLAVRGRDSGFNPHLLNIGTGFLSSFSHEAAFEVGSSYGQPAVEGLISGDLDQAGLFGIALTKKAKEKKAERKLARLEKREDRIENKIEAQKAKLGQTAAPVAARPLGRPGTVIVPRGVQVKGPRGNILRSFSARFPQKAAKIRSGMPFVYA